MAPTLHSTRNWIQAANCFTPAELADFRNNYSNHSSSSHTLTPDTNQPATATSPTTISTSNDEPDPPTSWAEVVQRAKTRLELGSINSSNLIRPNFNPFPQTKPAKSTKPTSTPPTTPFYREFTTSEREHNTCPLYIVGIQNDLTYAAIRSKLKASNFPTSAILNISKISQNTHEFLVQTAYAGYIARLFLQIGAKVLEDFKMNRPSSTEKQVIWNFKRLITIFYRLHPKSTTRLFIQDELDATFDSFPHLEEELNTVSLENNHQSRLVPTDDKPL